MWPVEINSGAANHKRAEKKGGIYRAKKKGQKHRLLWRRAGIFGSKQAHDFELSTQRKGEKMSTKRTRSDFINFIIDTDTNEALVNQFMKITTAKDLYDFFQKKGYKDIPANDCEDILKAKGKMVGRHIPAEAQTAKGACVAAGKAY